MSNKYDKLVEAINKDEEPTLKDYLKPKWNRFKRHSKSRKSWYNLGRLYLFFFSIVCLMTYQSRVMEIERKNAIVRYYFRKNDTTYQKEYQHIDSLINHYGVYDAYEEILKE